MCWAARPVETSVTIVSGENAASAVFESDIPSSAHNYTRRLLKGCGTGNPIDDCWRCDPHWRANRQSLANCAIGFGKNAIGGKTGRIYVVTDDSDDDVIDPAPGTLRYGAMQTEPLWIIFDRNMNIKLKNELIVQSYKTIDGRGANVHIAGGGSITIQYVHNVIIHGVHIHDIKQTGPAVIRGSPSHFGDRGKADGDAISIYGSHDIWIDHNYLSHCTDGLVDVTEASTAVTISNNYFTDHDKVMLLGGHPKDSFDKVMQVTVAFNHFGEGLVERIPRCRFGYFHIVNNFYSPWLMYAIGGSESPTINSEGNFFMAGSFKEVTKRIEDDGSSIDGWEKWNWRSSGDIFQDGAFFTDSGSAGGGSFYAKATSFSARPAALVASMTNDAGPLML
nr:probable pectate lyase 5 isoform X2 [Physcomitrium patens]|eukprot:XP_024386721.1 probable pectate lyase 5 isoform X2 [Physcomitrella patens]